MTHKIAIAAIFSAVAVLTPAHATTVLFSTTNSTTKNYTNASPYTVTGINQTTNQATGGTITAYGFTGVLPANPPPGTVATTGTNPATPTNYSTAPGTTVSAAGLGVNAGTNYIPVSDAVVLDFANVSSTVEQNSPIVTIDLNVEATGPADWTIYGLKNGVYTLLDSGVMTTGGAVNTALTTLTASQSLYEDYMIGVTNQDCELAVTAVSISYNGQTTQTAPEPGTFLMAGMALVAAGITMKKRTRKA